MTSGLDHIVGSARAVGAAADLHDPDRHGDQDAAPGMVDFAVNVRGAPPAFVIDAVRARLDDLAHYPARTDELAAIDAVGRAHGRDRDEIMLLSGAADGFEMLPRLRPKHAALIQPSFTEPELALRAAGIRLTQVELAPPWRLADAAVPDDADLVVLGNPTNPTSVLHPRATIEALRRPGRLIVVDEAFADLTVGAGGMPEPESMAAERLPDVIVIRSVTKTFGLAGLRAGYLLAAPQVLDRLRAGRRPWPLSTLALAALTECVGPAGRRYGIEQSSAVAAERDHLCARLTEIGVPVAVAPAAPFVLIEVADGLAVKAGLAGRGFAVRSCANFIGLGDDHLRLAVRPTAQVDALVSAIDEVRKELGHG
ncbi:Rv2231c family pyridoxal phosphate-dependent protein CobC [Gordonia sp. ABSL1-1]|uniref:Rv2231c family pyridoxal phosphate-dependent protein CobC n=1 Tax=Gordonia sp. ABSL1-1 TaxID=3053923 RepID=UPI0025747055|nr:Rv2231c family pyridoxal phosphate-dependent protein CobC [Gordonia sp. ABSL1-1]MDL9937326.1 Rv2231c family pyridoxal phosphate-dependent protein CobC [Gordonia sp. ABSL1-1]